MTGAPDREDTLTGDFEIIAGFTSWYLAAARDVYVYLPPGYRTDVHRRYPVLYLQDGQNIFNRATSYLGDEWQVDETAEALIGSNGIEPLIIVGVYNAGEQRIDEYTPVRDQKRGQGGKSFLYGEMLRWELKPEIDRRYRTLAGPRNTGLGGSSLGGLLTLDLGLRLPGVFGKLAVMSPSLWWADSWMLRRVNQLEDKLPLRIWLDMGLEEGERCVEDARAMRNALEAKGWREGLDLQHWEYPGAGHSEAAWAARMGQVLEFLFPPKRE